ncbi:MAG: indole-3-glycerol phosphate synthase TrpC [Rhodospirillales bacterium]
MSPAAPVAATAAATGVLGRICGDRRADVAAAKREASEAMLQVAAASQAPPRGFRRALEATIGGGGTALIAEIKRASPSKGPIRADADPAMIARAYAAGGATCLSVLTEPRFFRGSNDDLVAARDSVALPVLRKDFILDPWQVLEARAIGADCILLIMAALGDGQARELAATATDLGMDVLVEVHDGAELDRALALKTPLVGINNRNLATLAVDLSTTETLAPLVPADRLVVGESGLSTAADLARLAAVGVRACLVGESLMREPDIGAAVRRLLAAAPIGALPAGGQA